MHFIHPLWLVIGALACATLTWLYRQYDRRQSSALATFAASHLIGQLTVSVSSNRRNLKRFLVLCGIGLICVALARPQWGFRWEDTHRKGIDILFAIDTSRSMLAEDVKPNRITRAKFAISDLVAKLDGDRVGLIAFAGEAFLQAPLTLDYDAFAQSLDAVDIGIIPRGGTDIASAITAAQSAFVGEGANQKVLVLITDGEDLEAQGIEAAREAAGKGLKIYTVGVGSAAGELIPVPSQNGGTEFLKDENGQYVKSHLDENTLTQIAEATGGFYVPLGQQGEGLDTVYQRALAPLPKQELTSRMQRIYIERFQWPLGLGILCLIAEMLIGTRKQATRYGSLKSTEKRAAAVVGILLLLMPAYIHASPQSAESAYKTGKYDEAEKQYQDALQSDPQKPVLQFDYGTAAYKAGDWEQASPAFQKALETDQLSLQQQAYYNLGNTQYRTGQQTEKDKPEETINRWQQALQSYEAALKLKPDDADAIYNRDLVKRKLEKLQKQQQSKQSSSDKNSSNNGQQKQPQSGDKQDQNGQQPGTPNPQSAGQDKAGGDSQTAQQSNTGDNRTSGQDKKANGSEQASSGQSGSDKNPGQESRVGAGEMTKQEARDLLDSLKSDERIMPIAVDKQNPGAEYPVKKDW